MDKNHNESSLQNNFSSQTNPSKYQEARLKRALQNKTQSLQLQSVIGTTSTNKHNIQINPLTGDLFYIAGSTVVSYNIDLNQQVRFFFSPNKRNIVTLCFSPDGNLLATGEGTCKNPEIIIWDLTVVPDSPETEKPLKQLKGHKFGLKMLFFSPNMKYLISIGDENDKGLFVWDWQGEKRLTLNRLLKVPFSGCFSPDGTKFVTCGEKHIKLWQFQPSGEIIRTPAKEKDDAYILEGKSVNLGTKFPEKTFTDCSFDTNSKLLYASTSTGQLCIVEESRIVSRWIDAKVSRIFNITVSDDTVICSCSDGLIRVLSTISLDHRVTFPKLPPLLNYNIEKGVTKAKAAMNKGEYADVVGIVEDSQRKRLTAIYSDRSVFVWDISQLEKPAVKRSFLNHSGGITNLQILNTPSSSEVTFFMTASTDKTVRIWYEVSDEQCKQDAVLATLGLRRNTYSKNLSRIIYLSNDYQSFKHKDPKIHSDEDPFAGSEIQDNEEYPTCMKSIKDGSQIIIGTSKGRIMFIGVNHFEVESQVHAHEQEVSCLDTVEIEGCRLLASGGRDRNVKIYDLNQNNQNIITIDDFTASITSLRFAITPESQTIHLISVTSDRQIVFREYKGSQFGISHREVDKNCRINALDLSSDNQNLFVGFDKKINTYGVSSGKVLKSFETKEEEKQAKGFHDNISILSDVSSSYIACFNQDKVIRIRDCNTMQVVSKVICGEQISGMGFTLNTNHLITSSIEGCIYIWKMNVELKTNIEKKKQQLGIIQKKLQDLFKQEGVNLGGSKDWSVGSYWLEEEMRQYLNSQMHIQQQQQQQQLQQQQQHQKIYQPQQQSPSVPFKKRDDSLDSGKVVKPEDLIKKPNLPNWARSNSGLSEIIQQNLNPSGDILREEKKLTIPLPPSKKTNNFVGDNEFIDDDSINARFQSQISQQKSQMSNFGMDSINQRDFDPDMFGNSKKSVRGGSMNKFNNGQYQKENKPSYNEKIDNQKHQYQGIIIDENKVLGGEGQIYDDDDEEEDWDNDACLQFFGKEDKTLPVSSTQANLYKQLIATNNNIPNSSNSFQQSSTKDQKGKLQKNEENYQENGVVEEKYRKHKKDLPLNNKMNANSNISDDEDNDEYLFKEQNKIEGKENDNLNAEDISIQFKNSNGFMSVFDPEQIQGQMKKVGLNLQQAQNNIKLKEEHLNIFKSNNMPSKIEEWEPEKQFSHKNLINSIELNDREQPQFSLEDHFFPTNPFEVEEHNIDHVESLKANLEEDYKSLIDPKKQADISQDEKEPIKEVISQKSFQSSSKSKYPQKNETFQSDIDENIFILSGSSKKSEFEELNPKFSQKQETGKFGQKKDKVPSKNKSDSFIEEEIIEENISDISPQKEISKKVVKQQEQIQNGKKHQKEQDEQKNNHNYKDSGNINQEIIEASISKTFAREEIDEEFDESYQVSQKKEYKQYQELVDNSFKIILSQLQKIEDLVENTLDSEPVSVRKKIYEKIHLKSNKVKSSLNNIQLKSNQSFTHNTSSYQNASSFETEIMSNKDLLENYSKLLLEAVLKRK